MVEAAPASPFEVAEPNLLFEFLIIAFDAPAQFGGTDELMERDVRSKRSQPIFRRCLFALRPLDQQPLLWSALSKPVISMRRTNAHAGKA